MPEVETAEDASTTEPVVPSSPVHVRNIAFRLLAVATVILLLQFMQTVIIPFVIAGLLFYALDGAVDWLQKKRIPRALGAGAVLLVVLAGAGTLVYSLQGQALTVIDQLPAGARKVAALMSRTSGAEPSPVEKVQQAADALQESEPAPKAPPGVVRVQVQDQGFRAGTFVWSSSVGLLSMVNKAIMVLFLTYFMLLSDELFKRKLVKIMGTFSQKRLTVSALEAIASQVKRFMAIQILTSAGVAVVTGVALWMMGLEQAALWGLVAGILNSIPYYGALLVTAGLATVGFLQFGTLGMTAAVAGVSLLITTLEGSLLTPMLMSRASSMNQVAVFAGLLFWSWMWGIWGMLLAVPMMMTIKVICDHVEPLQPVALLLSE